MKMGCGLRITRYEVGVADSRTSVTAPSPMPGGFFEVFKLQIFTVYHWNFNGAEYFDK